MPHVNYSRGESTRFVFRREHGRMTHYNWYKGKRNSNKEWKRDGNRIYRARVKAYLHRVLRHDAWWDEAPPIDDEVRDEWDLW